MRCAETYQVFQRLLHKHVFPVLRRVQVQGQQPSDFLPCSAQSHGLLLHSSLAFPGRFLCRHQAGHALSHPPTAVFLLRLH